MGGDWHDSEGDLVSFHFGGAFWGGILLFMLLALEIADRVVMKRDLQIAKEIQSWLPGKPAARSGSRDRLCHSSRQYRSR